MIDIRFKWRDIYMKKFIEFWFFDIIAWEIRVTKYNHHIRNIEILGLYFNDEYFKIKDIINDWEEKEEKKN